MIQCIGRNSGKLGLHFISPINPTRLPTIAGAPSVATLTSLLTPPRRLSSYDDGEENAAHPHMMICRLRRNACIEERCQKGKEDLSQASFKCTHFAVAGKSSYQDERRSLRHHHMMISDAEGLRGT